MRSIEEKRRIYFIISSKSEWEEALGTVNLIFFLMYGDVQIGQFHIFLHHWVFLLLTTESVSAP